MVVVGIVGYYVVFSLLYIFISFNKYATHSLTPLPTMHRAHSSERTTETRRSVEGCMAMCDAAVLLTRDCLASVRLLASP